VFAPFFHLFVYFIEACRQGELAEGVAEDAANLVEGGTLHTPRGNGCCFESQTRHGAEEGGHSPEVAELFAQGLTLFFFAAAAEYFIAQVYQKFAVFLVGCQAAEGREQGALIGG